jgi:hypothetical protein
MERRKKTGGRTKGTPNKSTVEARALCARLLARPKYVKGLNERADAGTLPPAVESMLWHYRYGKPADHHLHEGQDGKPVKVAFHFHTDADDDATGE